MDGFDDVVGAPSLHVGQTVQPHDHHAAHRQQPDDPRLGKAQLRGLLHADVESRADHAADQAHTAADTQPFGQRDDIQGDMLKETFDAFHGVLLCGVIGLPCVKGGGNAKRVDGGIVQNTVYPLSHLR